MQPALYLAVRVCVACVFIYAGASKLPALEDFASVVAGYGLAPRPLIPWIALSLPILEVLSGVALLFDIRGALGVVTAMTLLFIAVLGYGLWLGLDVDCGCYGPGDPEGEAFHGLRTALLRDCLLMGALVYLYVYRRLNGIRLRSPRPPFRRLPSARPFHENTTRRTP